VAAFGLLRRYYGAIDLNASAAAGGGDVAGKAPSAAA
jgi:hypothetical protein